MTFLKPSYSAEKSERGPFRCKITKNPLKTLKIFWKSLTVPNKIERGDPLVSSGFVGDVKKVKNERGTICAKLPPVGLGLSSFSSFCEKWTDQCDLVKKRVTVRVGLFSFKGKCAE